MSNQITSKFSELMIDTNHPFLFMGIMAISLLISLAVYLYMKSLIFTPGYQYNYIVKKFVRKKSKKTKKLDSRAIYKQEAARQQRKAMDMSLIRLRWRMNVEEYNKTVVFQMIRGILVCLVMIGLGIALGGKLTAIFIIGGVGFMLISSISLRMKYSMDKANLDKDILKDIARMVSLYRYSDTARGFYGLVQDYLPTSNALRKDLEFYISDLNTYGEEESLDRLGERVQIPQIFKLITYIKSSSTATKAQFETNLQILDRELTEDLKELYRKESARKFRATILTVLPSIAFVGLILIASQVVDIANVLGESSLF